MIGFLYILRYGSFTKIGITRANLEGRFKNIDRTTAGRQRLAFAFLLFRPRRVEAELHRLYARKRTRLQGSGGTEWFKLNVIDRAELYVRLVWVQVVHFVSFLLISGLLLWLVLAGAVYVRHLQ